MDIRDVEKYVEVIIPNLEEELTDKTKSNKELLELYALYEDVLTMVAPHDFITYNKALEFNEDKTQLNRGFFHHRKGHIGNIFQSLNDMEVYDKHDMLIVSMPPRVGKSTTGIRFLSWIIGRYPEGTQLATSYSESITSSFYAGVMEIVTGEEFNKIFPRSPLINQNAKRQEIWLKVASRYPSITFVSIGGSMTGRSEASNYLYIDDLVSGIEEALSPARMQKLWELYTVNARQRMKEGAKQVIIATKWSVNDPITKLSRMNEDNPRCKILSVPALDNEGNSNFNFEGGFSTKYYEDMRAGMDEFSFGALYMGQPVEREGLLYHEEEMMYYLDLPEEQPDAIISVCDSKNLGKDYVAAPVGYVYGDLIYIEDVVFNNGLPEVTVPLVGNLYLEHNVTRADVELNNGGNYYAENVGKHIRDNDGNTSIRMFFTGNNKNVKIITYSDFVKKQFVFKDSSRYSPNSEYANFMNNVFSWSQTSNNQVDDAPDSLAMMAQLFQDMEGSSVKILNRRDLRI